MTREEKLISMKMTDLVEVAQKLNIKIDVKGSKSKAVAKILAAESAVAESEKPAEVETVAETAVVDNEQNLTDEQYAEIGKEIAEEAKQKAKRAQQKKNKNYNSETRELVVGILRKCGANYKEVSKRVRLFDGAKKCYAYILSNKDSARIYIRPECVEQYACVSDDVVDNKYARSAYKKTVIIKIEQFDSVLPNFVIK